MEHRDENDSEILDASLLELNSLDESADASLDETVAGELLANEVLGNSPAAEGAEEEREAVDALLSPEELAALERVDDLDLSVNEAKAQKPLAQNPFAAFDADLSLDENPPMPAPAKAVQAEEPPVTEDLEEDASLLEIDDVDALDDEDIPDQTQDAPPQAAVSLGTMSPAAPLSSQSMPQMAPKPVFQAAPQAAPQPKFQPAPEALPQVPPQAMPQMASKAVMASDLQARLGRADLEQRLLGNSPNAAYAKDPAALQTLMCAPTLNVTPKRNSKTLLIAIACMVIVATLLAIVVIHFDPLGFHAQPAPAPVQKSSLAIQSYLPQFEIFNDSRYICDTPCSVEATENAQQYALKWVAKDITYQVHLPVHQGELHAFLGDMGQTRAVGWRLLRSASPKLISKDGADLGTTPLVLVGPAGEKWSVVASGQNVEVELMPEGGELDLQ